MSVTTAVVNCGQCQACCKIPCEVPADEGQAYLIDVVDNKVYLQRQANGDCIYLDETGCSIYNVRPSSCREFSCEVLLTLPPEFQERIRRSEYKFFSKEVLEAAEERFPLNNDELGGNGERGRD